MPSLNKATIMGHLGRDPELKNTQSGTAVCNLSVATSYKPRDGEEKTEWHRVTAWGKTAENCGQYLSKGSLVYVEGRIETRKWTDKDGQDRYTTEIQAYEVKFLSGKSGGSSGRDNDPPPPDDSDLPF